MEPISVMDLSKCYGKTRAIDKLCFSVEQGEIFGFIGLNGAGKTTAIRIMLGAIKASSGSASIFGLDSWKKAEEIHKRLAYVPGDVNLWPSLTGREIIDFSLRMNGSIDVSKRDYYIDAFNLDANKKSRTYSKGNRQKVALICAMASNAELLIMDEPTTGLDPVMETVFRECISELKRDGCTILLSSHILSEVEKTCDRIGIIQSGHMVDIGSLESLRNLTLTNVYFSADEPVKGLSDIKNLSDFKSEGHSFSFRIPDSSMGELIKCLNSAVISSLRITPVSLEEIFMSHYK